MSSDGSKSFYVNGKRNYLNEGEADRKSTDHPRIFFVLAWCFLFFVVAGLAVKTACLSTEVEEQRLQMEKHKELLNQLLKSRADVTNNTEVDNGRTVEPLSDQDIDKTWSNVGSNSQNPINLAKLRSKRSPGRGRSRRGFQGCHLEGRNGPNIISHPGVPLQRPRSTNECILWKNPDNVPPAHCMMATVPDPDNIAIQYIKIDRPGFYYVYSQLTYQADAWTGTGHRVQLTNEASDISKLLLIAQAPPKKFQKPSEGMGPDISEESQYTGGLFYLSRGDLLAVYPLRAQLTFVMSETKSFFGVLYFGQYGYK